MVALNVFLRLEGFLSSVTRNSEKKKKKKEKEEEEEEGKMKVAVGRQRFDHFQPPNLSLLAVPC